MKNLRPSNLPFNTTALGSWTTSTDRHRYDRAAIKLAGKTGLSLPIAQVIADQNGLGIRRR